ncbi:septal ring lytic transglycosylase RlpA family protein [Methylobacterium sp. sgz302541]|uniref:septal ring lytic transglycosylase RlpA family protein n=1 Tax=unclassified Methylobacterium TaxID=2615210 RepID=UPI003D3301B5
MMRSTKGGPAPSGFPIRRILAVTGIALATANCSTAPQKFAAAGGNGVDPKYGVKASPRLYNEGDVIPKGGGRRFSGKPYVVAGRTYVPREDARGYVREGLASWYGSAFHGRQTANGEVFDRHSIAAAHPTLPLPSYARVTNLANGRSMVVRVNDRGPYHADRVMDVSEAVAEALEFRRSGTSKVRVEYVGKASVAGSDDRKLLATLRTDGSPAPVGGRSPIMVADLGPDRTAGAEEPLARSRAPLAFRPPEAAEPEVAPETPAPRRAAPVLVAAAAVAVPAALQPGAARATGFRPSPVAAHGRTLVASAEARPLALVSPKNPVVPHGPKGGAPLRLASAGTVGASFARMPPAAASASRHAAPAAQGGAIRLAGKAAPMPDSAKLAMARLASLPPEPPRKGAAGASASASPKGAPSRRARFAGID